MDPAPHRWSKGEGQWYVYAQYIKQKHGGAIQPANDYEAWLQEFDLRDVDAEDPRTMWALKYRNRLQRVLSMLQALPAGARVLEVGCSQANAALQAAERGWGAVGLDRELRALSYAKKKHEVGDFKVVCANVMRLPLASGTFDAVLALEILEHLPDPLEALRELRRVLKPGAGLTVRCAGYEGSVVMSERVRLNRLLRPSVTTGLSRIANRLPGARWWSYGCFLTAVRAEEPQGCIQAA